MHETKLLWLAMLVLAGLTLWPESPSERMALPSPPAAGTSAPEPVPAGAEDLQQRVATLEDELTREILLRQQLERRINELEGSRPLIAGDQQGETGIGDNRPSREQPSDEATMAAQRGVSGTLTENLLATGLPADTVQAVRNRIESNQLSLLELRNRAVREGWDDTPEYVEKVHEIQDGQDSLREEFGDDVYDKYLYANGSPNRVRVRDVFSGSAADMAGIRPGDLITGYASQRLFSMGELRRATTEGNAGESILVEIVRDGAPMVLSIPRGAMGISMAPARVEPN